MPRCRARASLPCAVSEDGPSTSGSSWTSFSSVPFGWASEGLSRAVDTAVRGIQALDVVLPFQMSFPWPWQGAKSSKAAAEMVSMNAAQLRYALRAASQGSDLKANLLGLLQLGGLAGALCMALSPVGPGGCDHNRLERCANCATSVPYVVAGVHSMCERRTNAGRAWGASMVSVGMASTAFHASSGKWRTLGRRLDYWTIALSSNLMLRAVFPKLPPSVTAAGVALTPFKPFLVSFVNSTAMELKYLCRALKTADPGLRRAQRVHAASCLLGLGAFALEELQPQLPLIHSAWHCLSAVAVATINHLVDDVERNELGLYGSGTGSAAGMPAGSGLPVMPVMPLDLKEAASAS